MSTATVPPKFKDGGSKEVVSYQRDREAAKIIIFKTTVLRLVDHFTHNGAGIQNQSIAWHTHREIQQHGPLVFLLFAYHWAAAAYTDEEFARRLSSVITRGPP